MHHLLPLDTLGMPYESMYTRLILPNVASHMTRFNTIFTNFNTICIEPNNPDVDVHNHAMYVPPVVVMVV